MIDSFNSGGRGTPGGKTARNDITGAAIKTPVASDKYRANWDRIFGTPKPAPRSTQEPFHPGCPCVECEEPTK